MVTEPYLVMDRSNKGKQTSRLRYFNEMEMKVLYLVGHGLISPVHVFLLTELNCSITYL